MYCIIVPAQIIANILMPEILAAMRHCIVLSVLPVEQIQPNAAVRDALFIWMGEPIPILAAVQKNSGDKGNPTDGTERRKRMRNRNQLLLRLFLVVGTILFLLFIFGNSLQDGAASGSRSAKAVEWIQSCFDLLRIPILVSELVIRKLAHFSEYFALGLLLGMTIRAITSNWWARIFTPLFFGLLIPVLDEGLQLLIPQRSGEVRDVLIDFSGVLLGILIITPLLWLLLDRKKSQGNGKHFQ